jgi:hypothetical protein
MDVFVAEQLSTMLIVSTNFITYGPQQSYVLDLDRRSVAEQVSSGINSFDCAWYNSTAFSFFIFQHIFQRADLGLSKSYSDIHDGILIHAPVILQGSLP